MKSEISGGSGMLSPSENKNATIMQATMDLIQTEVLAFRGCNSAEEQQLLRSLVTSLTDIMHTEVKKACVNPQD